MPTVISFISKISGRKSKRKWRLLTCDQPETVSSRYFGIPHCEQKLTDDVPQISLAEYMPSKRDVWTRIAQREGLDENAFEYATWAFAGMSRIEPCLFVHDEYDESDLDGSLKSANDRHGDLSKARRFGWTSTVDTFDGYAQCFDRLKALNIIPS